MSKKKQYGFQSRSETRWGLTGQTDDERLAKFLKDDEQGIGSFGRRDINRGMAMKVAAVYACVRIIAESLGSVDCVLYEPTDSGRGKKEAIGEPEYNLIKNYPNDQHTSFEAIEQFFAHAVLEGNSFVYTPRNARGIPTMFYPLSPDQVFIDRQMGFVQYLVSPILGQPFTDYMVLEQGEEILHMRGLSIGDGLLGLNPRHIGKDSISLSLDYQEFASRMFSNGAMPRGVLQSEDGMDEPEWQDLKKEWKESNEGLNNWGKTAFLPPGVKWQQIAQSIKDAEMIAGRKFQIADIARIFRVPLHLLQELDQATFNNIEQLSSEFVDYTLRPWAERAEHVFNQFFLRASQRVRGLYFKFDLDSLKRADLETRTAALNLGVLGGWITRNEARIDGNRDPLPGLDEPLMPLNSSPISQASAKANAQIEALKNLKNPKQAPNTPDKAPDKGADPVEEPSKDEQNRYNKALLGMLRDAAERVIGKQSAAVRKSVFKQNAKEFETWSRSFYEKDMREYFTVQMLPVCRRVLEALDGEDKFDVLPTYLDLVRDKELDADFQSIGQRVGSDWIESAKSIDGLTNEWLKNSAQTLAEGLFEGISALVRGVKKDEQ